MFNRSLKWIVGILRFSNSRKCLQKSTRSNAFVASKKVQNAAPLSTVYLCSETVTVCLSVYPSCRPLQQRWQLHGWYSAATVSRVMSSDVGSWTQTCCFCRHHGLSVGHKSNAFCPADVRLTWHYAWNGATPASENRHDGRRTRPTVTSHNTTKTRRHWGFFCFWNTEVSVLLDVHRECTNLPVSLSAKEFWKSVNIWGSYGQEISVLFFDSWCSLFSSEVASSSAEILHQSHLTISVVVCFQSSNQACKMAINPLKPVLASLY